MGFATRLEAGERLGEACLRLAFEHPLILGLARGGAPVALGLARRLGAPMDVLMVRKIGVPDHPEVASAAIVNGHKPIIVFNEPVMKARSLSPSDVRAAAADALREIERRREVYFAGRPPIDVTDRDVILVDDGAATGSSLRAAVDALRKKSPFRITIALPVAAPDALAALRVVADRVICLEVPERFGSVSEAYGDFHQLTDEEVVSLLEAERQETPRRPPPAGGAS
jgi:putative phosphoribosyl transferase